MRELFPGLRHSGYPRQMTRIVVLLLCTIFGGPWAALAHPAGPLFVENLTSPELKEAIGAGKTVILVPIGGTEQNGPHMALGKHNVRAALLAQRIAQRLGNALVAPVLAYVPEGSLAPPSAHMRFAGTVTIPVEAFEKTLESIARSFKLHGFKDIVFLGDHGGYQNSLKKVADRLNREWVGASARAHAIEEYYRAADADFAQALRDKGFSAAEIGTHAGLADTSLTLALDPSLVRPERLRSPSPRAGDGVNGDPRRASAELGQVGVELVVRRAADAIIKSLARR
ncbi:MAG TPA: creatininase family protein [Usitatibacter sp.]|nr:creatininase family protein [Usitatibacter sp.]